MEAFLHGFEKIWATGIQRQDSFDTVEEKRDRVLLLFQRLYEFLIVGTDGTEKNPKKTFSGVMMACFGETPVIVCCVYVISSARMCFCR